MTTEEEIKKAEQEVNRANKKLAEAKRKAQKEKRAEENSRKFMMGGLVAKYLREDMELDFMDFSEEEITRIVACGMKQRATRNMVQKVISERPATEQKIDTEAEVFFATPFWTKLQSKNGHPCMSKMDIIARGLLTT